MVLRYLGLLHRSDFRALVTMKNQGTNTSRYLSAKKLKHFPARRQRARVIKELYAKKKAKLTKYGKAIFTTEQVLFNTLACPSTILIWACQHQVLMKTIQKESEEGLDLALDFLVESDEE